MDHDRRARRVSMQPERYMFSELTDSAGTGAGAGAGGAGGSYHTICVVSVASIQRI